MPQPIQLRTRTNYCSRDRGTLSAQFPRIVALAIVATSVSCSADKIAAPSELRTEVIRVDSGTAEHASPTAPSTALKPPATPISFATYEGSGQVAHPDVVAFAEKWNGYRFWNVITPYPNSASRFENPSLFASNDGDKWVVPAGVINPLQTTGRGYLSDPDMMYVRERDELRLYYREVENLVRPRKPELHVADHVWVTTSKDASHWTTPFRVASDTGKFIVSPSVVRASTNDWRMYQVDAGAQGCSARSSRVLVRQSTDGFSWNMSKTIALAQPGYVTWHLDVQYLGPAIGYWAMFAAYPSARGCMSTSLFLATSSNGVDWKTYSAPILAAGAIQPFAAAVYRSTFEYASNDSVTIWYSGARVARKGGKKRATIFAWSAAVTHTTASKLLAHVADKTGARPLTATFTPGASPVLGSIVP